MQYVLKKNKCQVSDSFVSICKHKKKSHFNFASLLICSPLGYLYFFALFIFIYIFTSFDALYGDKKMKRML